MLYKRLVQNGTVRTTFSSVFTCTMILQTKSIYGEMFSTLFLNLKDIDSAKSNESKSQNTT